MGIPLSRVNGPACGVVLVNHAGRVAISPVLRFPRPRPWVMWIIVIDMASRECFAEWPTHRLFSAMLVLFMSV